MFWNWLRERAKRAVLAGLEDAAAEIESADSSEATAAQALHKRLLQPLLPAPAPETNGNGRRKRELV